MVTEGMSGIPERSRAGRRLLELPLTGGSAHPQRRHHPAPGEHIDCPGVLVVEFDYRRDLGVGVAGSLSRLTGSRNLGYAQKHAHHAVLAGRAGDLAGIAVNDHGRHARTGV